MKTSTMYNILSTTASLTSIAFSMTGSKQADKKNLAKATVSLVVAAGLSITASKLLACNKTAIALEKCESDLKGGTNQ